MMSVHSLRDLFRKFSLVLTAFLAVCLVVFFVGFALFSTWIDRFETPPANPSDGIVVLTGGAQRIEHAIDLLRQGYGRRLLITGVNAKTSREEVARLTPSQKQKLDCCIDLDYRARNTIDNAVEARRWMDNHSFRSLIVVTSNYHMPRALMEIRHAAPHIQLVAYPVVTPATHPDSLLAHPATLKLLATEYVKYVLMWLRTKLEPISI
jgi:uncharacterized SAM-binding protein YcdF (DUF218 family)